MYRVFCPDCGADVAHLERLNNSEELMVAFGKLANHRASEVHWRDHYLKKGRKEVYVGQIGLHTKAQDFTIRADDGRLIAPRPGPKQMEPLRKSLERIGAVS